MDFLGIFGGSKGSSATAARAVRGARGPRHRSSAHGPHAAEARGPEKKEGAGIFRRLLNATRGAIQGISKGARGVVGGATAMGKAGAQQR